MAEMKTLLMSSLGDMKREIQTLKTDIDVYAKKKKKVSKMRAPGVPNTLSICYTLATSP